MFIYKIGLCTVLFFLTSCSSLPDISRTNNKNLGPWLTISGDPSQTIDINWLTEDLEQTFLSYGIDRENLKGIINENQKEKLHHVSLENLQSGTTYYYSINNEIYQFSTASDTPENYTVSLIGDLQPFKKQSRISNEIMSRALVRENPDLIVQLGDVSESGGINFFHTETLNNITHYASETPFMAAPGNHDYYHKGEGNFRKIFPYDYPSDTELYHSLKYKNATFFFLDVHINNPDRSNVQKKRLEELLKNPTISNEQKKLFKEELEKIAISMDQRLWFEEELKKTAQLENQWIFVLVHDVVLASGSASMNFNLQKWLAPLADRYGVDAVFFGHSHTYEHWEYQYGKSGLTYDEEDKPTGNPVHYFCSGGGGAYMRIDRFLERDDRVVKSQWFDQSGNDEITVSARISKWDSENYIDQRDNPVNGAPDERKNYFQLPEKDSYSGYNSIYGYRYGEKTLHYINLNFSGTNNEICNISVHYPDGELLAGPEELYPQEWTLHK